MLGLDRLGGLCERRGLKGIVDVVHPERSPYLHALGVAGFDDHVGGTLVGAEARVDVVPRCCPWRVGAVADAPDVGVNVGVEGRRGPSVDEGLLVVDFVAVGG